MASVDGATGFRDRLSLAMEAKGLKKMHLEDQAGLSRGQLTRLLKGERGKAPTDTTMRKLAQALGVRQEWLALGEGPMRPSLLTDPPFLKNRPEWPDVLKEAIRRHRTIPADIFYDLGDSIIPRAPTRLDWELVGGWARELYEALLREEGQPASGTEGRDVGENDNTG